MYTQQPWYHKYPPDVSYNPYVHPSYQRPSPFDPSTSPRGYTNDRLADERRRALAERRARRAQWLPDEVDEDEDDDWSYGNSGRPDPSYWEAKQRLQEEERVRRLREEALRRQEDQRRQQILLQKQREEEQAKQRMWAEQRQQTLKREEQERQRAAERNKNTSGSPAPRNRSQSPVCQEDQSKASAVPTAAKPTPQPQPTAQSSKPQPNTEEQHKAASRIQQQYRVHAANRALDKVASDFEKLKQNFVYPRTIDFQKPGASGEHGSVPANRPPSEFDQEPEAGEGAPMDVDGQEGKLAYTSTNYPLHSYVDAMDKLLMRLDGVESAGKKGIREKRRRIVKDIEKEASKLERYWKQAWADYIRTNDVQQSDAPTSTESESVMDETSPPNFG